MISAGRKGGQTKPGTRGLKSITDTDRERYLLLLKETKKYNFIQHTYGLKTKNWSHKRTPWPIVYKAQLDEGKGHPDNAEQTVQSTDWLGLSVQLVQAPGK